MIFLVALIPATALTIGGYFALYLSGRTEGSLRTFGRYLGFWAFTLAALLVLGAMFAAGRLHGECPGMWGMHGGMHGRWMDERPRGPGPESAPPAAAPPAPASEPPQTR